MPSRLAALKVHVGKKTQSSESPLRPMIIPGVGFVQGAAKQPVLQRSNSTLSTTSSETAMSTCAGPEKVVLQLAAGAELPSVPYKLRFALSPQEWDERVECIARHRERSAQPRLEILWFLLVFGIPATVIYPLYTRLFTSTNVSTGRDPAATAGVITIAVVMLLAMLLATPLFVRKYVLQRRMNKDVDRWAAIDRRKTDEPDPDVRWRIRLPNIFRSTCDIHIPVPPRKRSISLEAAIEKDRIVSLEEKGLSRVGSITSQRSMFDD